MSTSLRIFRDSRSRPVPPSLPVPPLENPQILLARRHSHFPQEIQDCWCSLLFSFQRIVPGRCRLTQKSDSHWTSAPASMSLRNKKSSPKTFISVGGWDLGGEIFSDMTSFPGTRSAFVKSAISFMEKWGFDGIDIDWEYPAASDRGGKDADTANFVTLLKELKEACGDTYGISVTLPSSYWYLKGFDVVSMADYVDWFNFMAYDIHGTWDGTNTDSILEIGQGLDLLWRNDIDPSKVLLGLGFYGRFFTLADSSCNTSGCAFDASAYGSGGAAPGECTQTSGILSDYEISRIISEYNSTVVYSETAGVNWMTWNENQWVSFDNGKTLKQKADFANSLCLGGLFSWALDLGGPGSLENPNDMSASDTSMDGASTDGGSDGTGDFYVGQGIFDNHTVVGVGPLNMIFPPSTLDAPTTIQPDHFVTSIEVAWTATEMVTISETVVPTTTVTRVIVTTTITLDPIITSEIPYWNWNITGANQTAGTTVLFPSLAIGTVVVTDNLSSVTQTANSSRTLLVPPWPWFTTSLPTTIPTGPTVHFIQGDPPSPTCTAGCGTKCQIYCEAPCMDNCDVGGGASSGFDDPSDPDPPSDQKCSGPDCVNGECTGPLCVLFGCSGSDCDESSGICLGSDCEETGCLGDGCSKGSCTSADSCQTVGCAGDDCNGSGLCFGLNCISLGCIGLMCDKSTGQCSGIDCHKVSCSGPNCDDGVCTGEGCTGEDEDCEEEEADVCTEFVYSTLDTAASTYATETTTSCERDCNASVEFSNGCHMRVDYVSGCTTQNDGPAHFVSFEDGSTVTSGNSSSTAATLVSSSLTPSWTTSTSGYVESSSGVLLG
ncbi:glycosyl hydrolases family 18-domain-containing protein [Aspergillus desertorum]